MSAGRALRTAATPRTTARTSSTAAIPSSSTRLSFDPNVRMAQLLSHWGEASMAAWPTMTTGSESGFTTPATSSATAMATPPVTTPRTDPRPMRPQIESSGEGSPSDPGRAGGSVVRLTGPRLGRSGALARRRP